MAPEKGSVCICFLALLALTSEGFKYNYAQHANYTCPGWLSDYKATHQALRSNPNATYLVYHCHNNTHCNGAGDRIKGALFLLRVAAKYGKVLLLKWDKPAALTEFFQPNQIDWSLNGLDEKQLLGGPPSRFDTELQIMKEQHDFGRAVMSGNGTQEFIQTKVIRSVTNTNFGEGHMFVPMPGERFPFGFNSLNEDIAYCRCLFQFLFKPSLALEKATEEAIAGLYGAPKANFIAWHWRTGGSVGEQKLGRMSTTQPLGQSRLAQLMCALTCADKLRHRNTTTVGAHTPLLMITDMNVMRKFVAAGKLEGVTTLNVTAFHLESKDGTLKDYLNIFVEMNLLAQAQCLILSHSGFSRVSSYLSNSNCFLHIDDCLREEQGPLFGGVLVHKQKLLRRLMGG